ncbi:MAG: hypothetical protein ACOX8W_11425 [bacterium]
MNKLIHRQGADVLTTVGKAAGRELTLATVVKFFLPLALTSALMMTSHSIIAGGIARTVQPIASMAAYAVGSTVAFMGEAPLVMVRQMTLALVHDRHSFRTVAAVAGTCLGIVLGVLLLIGYTPLSRTVFGRLLSLPPELYGEALAVFRVTMFAPAASGLRSLYQATLIKRRQTFLVTQAMFARITVMAALVYCFTRFGWVKGGMVGAIVILSGMSTEAVFNALRGFRHVSRLAEDKADGEGTQLDYTGTAQFFYPLVLAALLFSLAKPMINAGLARTHDSVAALAAFSVATALGFIIIAPAMNVHQVTMVFWREPNGPQAVRAFVRGFGLFGFAALLLLSCPPVGPWILRNLIGVDPAITAPTLAVVRVFSLIPPLQSLSEFYAGLLLLRQETRIISFGKAVNTVAVLLVVAGLTRLTPELGSLVGGVAQVSGFAAETVLLYFFYRQAVMSGPDGSREKCRFGSGGGALEKSGIDY